MSEQLAYTYRSLSAEADTRIIQLQPAPDASHPLHCFIAELCLSSENLIEYEALSYTWGQPDFTESLFVLQDDGRTSVLMITPNLRDALQRLRLRDRERRIWVDAVCIDQQDDSDKREQIPFMAQIYKNAWRVLVWLGRSLEGQRALIDIKKAMRFHSRDDEKIRTHTSNLVKSLQSLVQLSWFSRRWVIQEVVLAVDVVLMCGPEDLPFVRLDRIVTGLLRDNETLDTTSRTALEPLAAISKLWRTWVFDSDQDKGLRLFDLLQVFSNLECAIDHDKIFALCGLASDCTIVDTKLAGTTAQNIVITIDYNRPVEALFRSITKQMLGLRTIPTNVIKWGNMMSQPIFREITDAVMERCNGNYRKDLPPWAPDWCLPRRREALHKFFKHGDRWVTHGARAEWEKLVQHRLHMMAHGIDSEPDRKEDETYPGLHQMVQRNPLELQGLEVLGFVDSVLEPFPDHPDTLEIKTWLQTMRFCFSRFTTDSQMGGKRYYSQDILHDKFEIDLDNLPHDKDTTCVHPDSIWCHFLSQVVLEMFGHQGTSRTDIVESSYFERDLYNLSLGRTDVEIDSKSWVSFRSAFRGRRLFSSKFVTSVGSEMSILGVGVGPDHLAVGTCFKTPFESYSGENSVHALSWDPQAETARALVGDVWCMLPR